MGGEGATSKVKTKGLDGPTTREGSVIKKYRRNGAVRCEGFSERRQRLGAGLGRQSAYDTVV